MSATTIFQNTTYWQGEKQRPVCNICGGNPVGEGCYHICQNSTHYYTPEQERYDDAYSGRDRWEGYGDPDPHAYDDDPDVEINTRDLPAAPVYANVGDDDIPF